MTLDDVILERAKHRNIDKPRLSDLELLQLTLDTAKGLREANEDGPLAATLLGVTQILERLEETGAKLTKIIMQEDIMLRALGTIEIQLAQLQEQQERLYHGQAILAERIEKWPQPQESQPKLKVVQKRQSSRMSSLERQQMAATLQSYCDGHITIKEIAEAWRINESGARKRLETFAKKIGWHGRYKVGAYQAKVRAGRENRENKAYKDNVAGISEYKEGK